MILQPSFPQKSENYDFKPDDIVYVPVMLESHLFFDSISNLICDTAYKTKRLANTHFWISDPLPKDKVEIRTMTVLEFLKQHDWQGMNHFETLNKLEFKIKYQDKYKVVI